ncbi:hypothetical protein E3N88_28698 [Mikania micrantha]|uniref:Uncharacterized protein n=1 Tax=Mikania micrantha TaxID=192012 RepID=A0A5N6N1C0_9ASTR|nr:hypothetical protein E3N88_28698 [Mikania micrantha]
MSQHCQPARSCGSMHGRAPLEFVHRTASAAGSTPMKHGRAGLAHGRAAMFLGLYSPCKACTIESHGRAGWRTAVHCADSRTNPNLDKSKKFRNFMEMKDQLRVWRRFIPLILDLEEEKRERMMGTTLEVVELNCERIGCKWRNYWRILKTSTVVRTGRTVPLGRAKFIESLARLESPNLVVLGVEYDNLQCRLDGSGQVFLQPMAIHLENSAILMPDFHSSIWEDFSNCVRARPTRFQFARELPKTRVIKQNAITHLELLVVLQVAIV